jgi:cytochrome c oxidase subunit III
MEALTKRRPVIANGVLGMVIFTVTEAMFFLALISAFVIIKSHWTEWPPAGQPRLPVGQTAFNTALLILSAPLLFTASRRFVADHTQGGKLLLGAILSGGAFVVLQGMEWIALIREGLTLTSSSHGSFFYLIVGIHALHVVIAMGILGYVWLRHQKGTLDNAGIWTAEVLWYFVVGVWPILYWQVYLT